SFLQATAVGWVVFDLFLVRDLKLSPLELILMGTVMEATIFVFEIPTGIVADTYSRRLSLIVGFVGMGAAVVLVGASSTAWVVIALWGLWGLSYTFTSGAFQAWIADEVGAESVGSLFLRGKRVGFAGALAGLALGVAIGVWSLRAAVIVTGAIELSCGLVCIVAMPETGFRRRPRAEREHALRELWTTAASGMRFVRGQTLVLILVVFTLATIAGQTAFALAPGFWVVMVVFLAALLARGLLAPLYTTWLNRQISDSSIRATVLSISGQADAIGQATGGPVLGVVG